MTTTPAPVFHKPELASPLPEYVVMVHRDGAWAIIDTRRVYNDRASADAHLAESRSGHEAMLRNTEDYLANTPGLTSRRMAELVNEIETERAVTYAVFTRTIPPYTFA